jgi:pimeloyl-ACP methyl ester carboxylesterase
VVGGALAPPPTTDGSGADGRVGYAPYPLGADEGSFSLSSTRAASPLGTAVVRSRRTNRSSRATIFLHGAAGSWSTWTALLTAADHDNVAIPNPVLIDFPGWGDGTLTTEGEGVMLETLSSLVRAGAEALGYTEWDLVGHSMGGFVAMHMASIWPESVLSVATVSASSWTIMDAAAHPARHFWRLPRFVLLWRAMQAMSHLGRAGARLAAGLARLHLLRAAVAPLFRYPRRVPASVVTALGLEVRPRSFALAVRMGQGYDATARWSAIECPVRAVNGDRDVFSPPDDLRLLGEIQPNSHRETIAGCGHFGHIERPHQVLAALGYRGGTRQATH